jgi:hypothetical protein
MISLGTKLAKNEVSHNPETGVTTIFCLHKGQRMEILIDTADWPLVEPYSWYAEKAKKTFYANTNTGSWKNGKRGKRQRLHALLFPEAQQVDHQDHNGLNCCRGNLRPSTHQQNNWNRTKNQKPTSCKYLGVSWDKTRQKFQAGIKINGKRIALGRFDSAEEAARVRDAKALELFGEFASLNFRPEQG